MSLTDKDIDSLKEFLESPLMRDKVDTKVSWRNFLHNIKQHDAIVIDVKYKYALHDLMKFISSLNDGKESEERVVVRAAAGGRDKKWSDSYSATPLNNADIVIRLTGEDFTFIHKKDEDTVTVGASMQIGEVDSMAYKHLGKVLPTSSLIPYVTVAGLAGTGGNGTGYDQGGFCELIKGMTICTENGDIVHIDDKHPDFNTIRAAHNGMFGFILDMDLKVVPAKKLQCVMEKRSAAEFMEEVENGLFQYDPYVSVMYMPTYLEDEMTNTEVNNVIIYRWRPVPLNTENVNHTPVYDGMMQQLQTDIGPIFNVPDILAAFPKLIPYYMRYAAQPLAIGDKDEISVGPWPEQMHYRTAYPNDIAEVCGIFPVKDTPHGDNHGKEMVAAMRKTIELLDQYRRDGNYPLTYGVYFRFLQGTKGGLSPNEAPDGYHVCSLDLTTSHGIPGFEGFKQEMQDYFLNELNGRLHWGKNAPANIDYQQMYGVRFTETKNALERWHQEHNIDTNKSMMLNPLLSKVLGYPVPSLVDRPTPVIDENKMQRSHITTLNARRLLAIVGDDSEACHQIERELNDEINKYSVTNGSIFKPAHPVDDVVETVKEINEKCCTIL